MILDNFRRMLTTNPSGSGPIACGGGEYTVTWQTANRYCQWNVGDGGNADYWLDVGFGDTAEDKDDYKLDDSNAFDTPTLTFVSGMCTSSYPSIKTLTAIYQNNTANDVTVKEIGLCLKGSYQTAISGQVLFAREVLTTPIVVPAGEKRSFTYDFKMTF